MLTASTALHNMGAHPGYHKKRTIRRDFNKANHQIKIALTGRLKSRKFKFVVENIKCIPIIKEIERKPSIKIFLEFNKAKLRGHMGCQTQNH